MESIDNSFEDTERNELFFEKVRRVGLTCLRWSSVAMVMSAFVLPLEVPKNHMIRPPVVSVRNYDTGYSVLEDKQNQELYIRMQPRLNHQEIRRF